MKKQKKKTRAYFGRVQARVNRTEKTHSFTLDKENVILLLKGIIKYIFKSMFSRKKLYKFEICTHLSNKGPTNTTLTAAIGK